MIDRRYFNLNGISFTLLGDIEQAKGLVGYAQKIMFLNEISNANNLEQAWNKRRFDNGAEVKVAVNHGRKSAEIYFPPIEKIIPKPEKKPRLISAPVLCPAFHTYDADKNWLGITICTSGKWGPPYKFIAAPRDKIYPFEYGMWNTESGAVRPEDYDKRLVAVLPGASGELDYYSEVPAAHEYTSFADFFDGEDSDVITEEWTSGNYADVWCCDNNESCGHVLRDGQTSRISQYTNGIVVCNDWLADSNVLPRIMADELKYNQNKNLEYFITNINVTDPNTPGEACKLLLDALDEEIANPSNPPPDKPEHGSVYRNLRYHYTSVDDTLEYMSEEKWGTFVDVGIYNGSVLVGEHTDKFSSVTEEYPLELNCAICHGGSGSEHYYNKTDNYHDIYVGKIIVLGVEYEIYRDEFTSYSPYSKHRLINGNVRIYQVGDSLYTLVCAKLQTTLDDNYNYSYQYMLFGGDIEQYNDPNATFDITETSWYSYDLWHPLGFSVKKDGADIEGYTNGEYSLIEIMKAYQD